MYSEIKWELPRFFCFVVSFFFFISIPCFYLIDVIPSCVDLFFGLGFVFFSIRIVQGN